MSDKDILVQESLVERDANWAFNCCALRPLAPAKLEEDEELEVEFVSARTDKKSKPVGAAATDARRQARVARRTKEDERAAIIEKKLTDGEIRS